MTIKMTSLTMMTPMSDDKAGEVGGNHATDDNDVVDADDIEFWC